MFHVLILAKTPTEQKKCQHEPLISLSLDMTRSNRDETSVILAAWFVECFGRRNFSPQRWSRDEILLTLPPERSIEPLSGEGQHWLSHFIRCKFLPSHNPKFIHWWTKVAAFLNRIKKQKFYLQFWPDHDLMLPPILCLINNYDRLM